MSALRGVRPPGWATSLEKAFDTSLPPIPGLDSRKKEFWAFVARFLQVLDLGAQAGRRSQKNSLYFNWTEREGFAVGPATDIPGERRIPELWGERLELGPDLRSISEFDNATTRSLCRGNGRRHVLVGPLAFVNHTCRLHANISPRDCTTRETRDAVSGFTASDFRMATAIAIIPRNTPFGYEYA